ncbi:transposase [Salipaludibacillus sp. CF4.18]|uniref:transposase n=1 Tax=Salipaludibacillus sp. CF4.18 TaxID=3373081 RepID=UPI003EE573EA
MCLITNNKLTTKAQKMKEKRIETMRTQLIKIAGKVILTGRYTVVKLCNSCLYQKEFRKTLLNIQKLPPLQ